MTGFDFIDIIAHFHKLVMLQSTGNSKEFAKKLGISRSTLYNIIEDLKSYDIDIYYSRAKETFYYKYPNDVIIKISIGQTHK